MTAELFGDDLSKQVKGISEGKVGKSPLRWPIIEAKGTLTLDTEANPLIEEDFFFE